MEAKTIYQNYLKEEFERRRSRNASYSLRAFARDLEVPSPKLSQYLNGDCGISGKRAAAIASHMQLGPTESELFVCAAEAAHARDPFSRTKAAQRLQELLASTFSEINLEKFTLIRDWYHFAILELTEVESFQGSIAWIAKALRIAEEDVKGAVERLEKLGMLNRDSGKWVQTEQDLETPPDYSSRAVREYHHQMLRLTDSRFEDVPVPARELGSMTFSVDSELIPELKQLMRRFQKEAAVVVQRSRKKNSLYALNLQLMPIFEGEVAE